MSPQLPTKVQALRIFAFVTLFFVLLCAASFALSKSGLVTQEVATTEAKALSGYDYLVLYTAHGFVPASLDVPLGSRVAFKNTSSEVMVPGSDPYPAHSDYPDFAASKPYALDETYIFQFTHSGTFGYANDPNPAMHGTIHVIDPSSPTPEVSTLKLNEQIERDKLLTLLDPNNSNSIFALVDAIQANPALSLNCHEIAHDLGHRAYEYYGFSGAMTFNNPDRVNHVSVQDICAGGYVHGILEEVSLHQPEFKNNPGLMCEGVPVGNQASCFHGVGHALMFSYKRAVEPSLKSCRSIGNISDTDRCFEGVWMELFWGDTEHSGPNTLNWDLAKPLAPCLSTENDAKPGCFLYSTFGYLRTHVHDYAGVIKMCTQSSLSENDTDFCLKGVGITMISHFHAKHLEQSESYVVGLNSNAKLAFYEGVMGYGRFSGVSESKLQNSCYLMSTDSVLCQNAVVNSL
jgi:plastocyanin